MPPIGRIAPATAAPRRATALNFQDKLTVGLLAMSPGQRAGVAALRPQTAALVQKVEAHVDARRTQILARLRAGVPPEARPPKFQGPVIKTNLTSHAGSVLYRAWEVSGSVAGRPGAHSFLARPFRSDLEWVYLGPVRGK